MVWTALDLVGDVKVSVWRVTLEGVEVTQADVARIPRTNVRVPVAEFVRVWADAERIGSAGDWYAAGVAMTCRWMACGTLEWNGRRTPARAPVTARTDRAYEELIEAELLAADQLALQQPPPRWLDNRPGWLGAVRATLRWAWRHEAPAPLVVGAATSD